MLHLRNHHDVQFMRRHIIYPAQNSFTHALLGNPLCHWDEAIAHYQKAYGYNPKFISALTNIAYCYEQKKDYKSALEWYEKYLKVAKPGSRGYNFATQSVKYLKGELFMEEK